VFLCQLPLQKDHLGGALCPHCCYPHLGEDLLSWIMHLIVSFDIWVHIQVSYHIMRGVNSISLVGNSISEPCGIKSNSCDPIRLSPGAWILEGNDAMPQVLV
jgi:hypothetical protein